MVGGTARSRTVGRACAGAGDVAGAGEERDALGEAARLERHHGEHPRCETGGVGVAAVGGAARGAGALGVKVCGAGGGGCLLAFSREGREAEADEAGRGQHVQQARQQQREHQATGGGHVPGDAVGFLELGLALRRVVQHERDEPADGAEAARAAYLARFPEAEELFGFTDFSIFRITPISLRYVAGFGSARTLKTEQLNAILNS